MKFLSLDNYADNCEFKADLCIVGTGAIGITMGLEFKDRGHDVLLLESGKQQWDPEIQELYSSDITGLPIPGVHDGRVRMHGGTTTKWAGQASRMETIDFEARPWVPHSGWPFSLSDLSSYYARAESVMQLVPRSYELSDWPRASLIPEFDDRLLQFRYSQFTHQPNFAKAYRADLVSARNIRVLMHANAVSIMTDPARRRVESIAIKNLEGKKGIVRARHFVICCGGIETARLLLASNRDNPSGVGNQNDLVGRFFQEHIHGLVALVHPVNRKTFQRQFEPIYSGRNKLHPKLGLSRTRQRELQTLQVAGDIYYEQPPDSAVEAAKLLLQAMRRRDLRELIPRAIWNIARRPHELLAAAFRYLVLKQVVTSRRGQAYLGIQVECQPNPESRVKLGTTVDKLGMPRAIVEWKLSEMDRHSIDVFVKTLDAEFNRLSIAKVELREGVLDGLPGSLGVCHDASHHMGTTRMSDDPQHGVVDRNCKVHGIDNLYIGGSAVFPTSSFSNPTLTAIALSLRLADHLGRLLA